MKRKARIGCLSWQKRLLFWLVVLVVPVTVLESGLRVYFASQMGTPLLFYGTRLNRRRSGDAHSGDMNLYEKYFKYYPHEERYTRDKETGKLIRTTINSSGFRGPDFEKRKAPHVIRVVTLGASSTFGFSDRDEETYPYYLEQLLNRRSRPGDRFEVLNLGIPHLKSGQVLALFEAEALPLDPDVVTFYEGVNDSWSSQVLLKREKQSTHAVRKKLRRVSVLHRSSRWLRDHFITVFLADRFVKKRRNVTFTEADVADHIRGKRENYLSNVSAIYDECRRRGITFIVASQQARSLMVAREAIKGVTYEEESELVRRDLARNKSITRNELYFLTHNVLMNGLRNWAADNNVPYVDVIAAMDGHRDYLVSWVHLNREGNRVVAEAFAKAILAQVAQRAPLEGVP